MLALITVSSRTKAIWLDTVNWSCRERGGLPAGCELWPALMNFKHFFIIYATFHFIFFIYIFFYVCFLFVAAWPKFNGCAAPKKQATQFFISHVATLSASCPIAPTRRSSKSQLGLLSGRWSLWPINFCCHAIILIASCCLL